MSLLLHLLYWALGVYLTAFAGRTTYFSKVGSIVMERPINALLLAAIWVFFAHTYTLYIHKP